MRTAQPDVSVITIFRDEARFLQEAVDSIYAQTSGSWELLLVDDGSSDGSTDIARDLARADPARVRYLDHGDRESRGTGASRNRGLAEARGAYVAFLDADDVWLPDKLTEQTDILNRTDAGLVYGRIKLWYSWADGGQEVDTFLDLGVEPDTLVAPPSMFAQLLANRYQSPTTTGSMVVLPVAERVGGFEDSFRGMYEDQAFFAKVFLDTPTYVSDRCWAWYRQRPDSLSARFESGHDYSTGRLPFLRWVEGYLWSRPAVDVRVRAAVRREIFALRHPAVATCSRRMAAAWGTMQSAAGLGR